MKLFTQKLLKQLPTCDDLYKELNPIIYAKLFISEAKLTWYVATGEWEDDDFYFFGYLSGDTTEWGHFSRKELQRVSKLLGLPIERGLDFKPARWSEVKKHEMIEC